MRPTDKATADNRSVQSFAIIQKKLDTGILLLAVFTLELEMDYPSETRDFIVSWSEISLCTVAPSPQTTLLRFFLRGGGGGGGGAGGGGCTQAICWNGYSRLETVRRN